MIIAADARFRKAKSTPTGGLSVGALGVVNAQRDIFHTIAVKLDMFGHLAFGLKRRGYDQANVALFQHIATTITQACLQASIGNRYESPRMCIIVCGLLGISYIKLEIIEILNGHEILFRHWQHSPYFNDKASTHFRYCRESTAW